MSFVADRFEILSLAGQGGMGRVFRARDTTTGAVVALKQLSVIDSDTATRFQREGAALERLDHPGIVRHVAHGLTHDDLPYLAMEWVDGEELRLRLKREGTLDGGSVATLARRLADALAHAHGRGIVHRDIKPSNIVLQTPDFASAVLIDFGLARGGDDELTRTGMLVGTPIYMAPEQVRDNAVTPSVDVFALGCVMYQCLAQTTPFAANGATAVLTRVLFDEPVPIDRIAPDAPAALSALIMAMLRKNAAERPTMREVASALEDFDHPPASVTVASAHLSTAELRVVSVIVAGAPSLRDAGDTLRQIEPVAVDVAALRSVAERFGADATVLPNGAAVAVLASGSASDLAARAAECAIELKLALPETPIGLATGSARTSEGVPLGEAIDRAVALAPFEGDAVRVDDVTAGLLGARHHVTRDADGLVLRRASDRAEAARTFLGKPTPCVGRDAELATLDGMIAQSGNESVARAALVTGPAGIGKSRIRQEIVTRCAARGTAVWLGRADVASAGVPFGILAQMIRTQAGLVADEPAQASREKLRARVAHHVAAEDVSRVAAFLGEIVAVRFDDDVQLRAARSDPQLMGDQMQRAFVDFVDAECRALPLVLVLEDLQWGDAPTVAAVDAALRVLEERPLAVVAFARPDVQETFEGLWDKRGLQPLPLSPLPKRAATRLARAVLGDAAPESVVGDLVEKAAGNAFFLEELLRAEVDGRAGEVPATLVAMVQSRLGALEPEARRVLRAASILGGSFGGAGVRALLGDDRVDVDRWLTTLVDREVLASHPREGGHGLDYAFRHALVREGAYAMLTDDDRALGHRLAAEWLSRSEGASPLVIAAHFERAGERLRAAAAYLDAAEQSLESSDLGGAIEQAERGVSLGADGELRGALRVVQAHAHHWLGKTEAMQAAASEAVSLLSPNDARWADAMTLLAVGKQRLGSTADLTSVAEHLYAMLAREGANRTALARAGGRIASLLFFAGKQDRAAQMLDAAERAAHDGGADVVARIHQARAPHARQAGRPEEALAHAEAAEAAFRTAGDLRNACLMSGIRGFALSELGAYAEAEGILRATLATAQRLGLTTVAATATSNLGMVYLRLGRAREAEDATRRAIVAFESSDRRHEGGSHVYLALVLREMGAFDAAEREARRALVLLDAALALKPLAGAVLATVLLAMGRAEEALAAAREAMLWPDSGGRIEEGEPLLRLTLARALFATGRGDEARAVLAVARDRLLARAATIRRPELHRTFLANVPEHATTLELAATWGV
ncbi:MAG TPA: protein kinase [Polyangiaceae bacterium]|jgi:tetratricopeptide (TPR) repeat protein